MKAGRARVILGLFALAACAKAESQPAPAAVPTAPAVASAATASAEKAPAGTPIAFDGMPAVGTKAYCPVGKEEFAVKASTQSSVWNGKTYVFCCPDCKPEFDKNPAKFVH